MPGHPSRLTLAVLVHLRHPLEALTTKVTHRPGANFHHLTKLKRILHRMKIIPPSPAVIRKRFKRTQMHPIRTPVLTHLCFPGVF